MGRLSFALIHDQFSLAMKSWKFILSSFVIAPLLWTACNFEDDVPQPTIPNKEYCFQVIDELSSDPLDSVLVTVTVTAKLFDWTIYLNYAGYTSGGECCLSIPGDQYPAFVNLAKPHYTCYSEDINSNLAQYPIIFRLKRNVTLSLHLKNVTPSNEQDSLWVYLSGFGCDITSAGFAGAKVDTTFTWESGAEEQSLTWLHYNNGILIDEKYLPLHIPIGGTFSKEIFY